MDALLRLPVVDFLATVVALGLLLRHRSLRPETIVRLVFLAFAGLVLSQSLLLIIQYQLWRVDPLMRLTLPPYTNITYYLHYSYFAFIRTVIWRLVGAVVVFVTMLASHMLFRRSLFRSEEFRLVPALALLPAFPLNLLLLPVGLMVSLVQRCRQTTVDWREKQSLENLWLPLTFILTVTATALIKSAWLYRFQP